MAEAPKSILVIGVARIGDTLMMTPVLRALKEAFPRASLNVLAHPKRQEVLAHLPYIDRLAGITKGRAFWRGRWAARSHDLAIVYGRDVALVRYALRVSRRVVCFDEPAFSGIVSANLLKVPRPTGSLHGVRERLLLTTAAGVEADFLRLEFAITAVEKAAAQAWLAAQTAGASRPRIGLQLFSFPTKAHRDWPLERFAAFIEAIRRRYPEALFVVLGDKVAASGAMPLVARFPGAIINAAGRFSLRGSAALMGELDLYVGVDTGPTHLAGALGIPMVALYHHLYPGRNLAPLQNERCRVIEHPATLADGRGEANGMEAISAEAVAAHALALLAEHCPAGRN